jgi:NAD(P)H dehydrogenase (quinone)
MPDSDLILITGASGRIGGRVADLLSRGGYRLRLMTRNAERAPHLPGTELVHGDYAEPASLPAVFTGVGKALIVSASGEPGKRALRHRNAFEAAARARVAHIVYLSLQGSGSDSKYPYSRDHFLSEQFLALTRVPYTVLRDSFYIDMFLKEDKFDADGILRGPAGKGRGAFVSREDVATAAAASLRAPHEGIYDVTGPEALTLTAVAERLSALTGRELRYEEEPVEAMRARLRSQYLQPWPIELATGWFEAIAAGELQNVSDTVRRFTGTAPLSMEEYFRRFPDLVSSLKK